MGRPGPKKTQRYEAPRRAGPQVNAERSAGSLMVAPRLGVLVALSREGPRGDPATRARGLVPGRDSRQSPAVQASGQVGRVTVSGNLGDDMPKGTFASVKRQAGLKRG